MNYPFASLGPAIQVITLVMLLVMALLFLGILVYLAGLPGRIAVRRRHPQAEAVSVCGWLGLLTGLFWFVALVWAYIRPHGGVVAGTSDQRAINVVADQLEKLESTVSRLEQQVKASKS